MQETTKKKRLVFDTTGSVRETKETVTKKPTMAVWSLLGEATGLGLSISLPMAGGALVGVFLDKQFGTTPILTLSLLVLGVVISVSNFLSYIRKIQK